jgi:hypothetical protein
VEAVEGEIRLVQGVAFRQQPPLAGRDRFEHIAGFTPIIPQTVADETTAGQAAGARPRDDREQAGGLAAVGPA